MMNNVINPSYHILLQKYLVNCCMRYELACTELDDEDFETMVTMLVSHWEDIQHPHKELIDLEFLKARLEATYIDFPSIVRALAVEKARDIPGSPCHGWTYQDKEKYIQFMMGKNFNHVSTSTEALPRLQ